MADISPFRAVHFDPERTRLEEAISPPYDVLSPAEQGALYERSPDNIVRLILNREEAGDDPTDRYTRAASFLSRELERGVLVRDDRPALYEYLQQFTHPLDPAQAVSRMALFVALRLQSYSEGVVLPHEETHAKAKADRLELMRATRANPEPIYGLYEDPDRSVAARLHEARAGEPLLHARVAVGEGFEEHTVFRHEHAALLEAISGFFRSRRIWIADGHHRYETALTYRDERRRDAVAAGPHDFDSILIGLSAFEDPGLVVLPTHRLVKGVSSARMEDLALQLDRYFHLHVLTVDAGLEWIKDAAGSETRFAILLADRAYALVLRDPAMAAAAMDERHGAAWKRLSVSILQALVLDRSLGISQADLAHTPDVAYTRDALEAAQRVRSGEFQLACLLQSPRVDDVREVAAAGDKMPQKSTFFYPKLWSGLVLRTID